MKKRVRTLLVAIFALALLFTACKKDAAEADLTKPDTQTETKTNTEPDVDVEKVVTVVAEMATDNFDPISGALSMSSHVKNNIYNSLVKYDGDNGILPSLAESWTEEADGVTVTFKLTECVKFHNGEDFTADDVVFSYEQALTSPIGAGLPMLLAGVEKVDDYTVKVMKTAPYIRIFDVLINYMVIIPKDYVTENPEGLITAPVGTGAFIYESQDVDGAVTLKANPDYFMGQPEIDTYIVRVPMEASSATIALESGEIDIVTRYPATQYVQAKAAANVELYTEPAFGAFTVIFSGEPFKSNMLLREAVYHAINPTNLILLSGADGEPISDYFAPKVMGSLAGYQDISGAYDKELAMSKLAESGYDTSQPITIATTPDGVPLIQAMQGQLAEIGITIEIEQIDLNIFYDRLMKGELTIMVSAMGGATPGLVDMLQVFSTAGDYMSSFGEKSAEFDAIMAQVIVETDAAAREELVKQALDIFADMYNIVPVYNPNATTAYNTKVVGVHGASTGILYAEDLDVK